jgi:S-DNA-T family DNA segregation ATPase FtsK/SpoIIIE
LNSYGLQANVIGTRLTPNGCLVRLAGSDRLRVEDIESKRMQLLTTHSLQLVTVQPKPGEIIVSIAGEKRHAVSLWDVWARRELKRNASGINTSFVLGLQELNGNVLYLNLGGDFGGLSQHEPHSLVAGATGSGKSVLIQSLLLDIAATNPSNLARIVLIDPKMGVDYAALEALPHLREPIITTQGRAIEVLKALVEEMDQRYRQFAEVRARDLPTFNSKVAVDRRLAMIVLVHDEFADWMLDDNYKGVVSAAVARLGVKARAAGIHLVFAAQRPDKDVMPMQLRENLGNRLILKVASEATSKIALDRPGAELLLGKGHLAAKLAGEQGLLFGQAPLLSDTDIDQAAAAIAADNTTSPD